jgi:hypothetical protein
MLHPPLLPFSPWNVGLGGYFGSGRQWMPWVHLADVVGLCCHALENDAAQGAINAVSPNPVRAQEFARLLGRQIRKPAFVPIPMFALKLLLGEFAEALVISQKVSSQQARALGYAFRYPTIEEALKEIF